MGSISPRNAADALLSNVQEQLVLAGVEVPKRVGKYPGNMVAWDGELLAVSFGSLSRASPARADQPATGSYLPAQTILIYEMHVTLLRKVSHLSGTSQGGIPSAAKLSADFDLLSDDVVALDAAMYAIHSQELIVPIQVPFWYGPVEPVGPQGDLAGTLCSVNFQAGFAEDGTY